MHGAFHPFALIFLLLFWGCSDSSTGPTVTSTPLAIPSDEVGEGEDVLPDFVVSAAAMAMPDALPIAAARDEEGGVVTYDVLVENEEGVFEIEVSATGVVLEIAAGVDDERPISARDLPQAVLDAVEATVPGGRITKAVRESVRGNVVYDIEVDVRGRKFDLQSSEDGTVLSVEEGN